MTPPGPAAMMQARGRSGSRDMLGRQFLGLFFDKAALKIEGADRPPDEAQLDPVELTYRHIWRRLRQTGATQHPTDRNRPNVLVLQMAKVASQSIRTALSRQAFNVFHCHGLSTARQDRDLDRLRRSKLHVNLVSQRLSQHLQYLSLHMLVRWYQENKTRHGKKLKVITLTRDPAGRYPSSFMQHRGVARSQIQSWHRARFGADPAQPLDEDVALRDFVIELASIIVEGGPSTGPDGCRACERLARERWPDHYIVEEEISEMLRPLTWFDTEIGSVFGVDVLAAPALAKEGWAEVSTDCADILVLRFEKLGALAGELARFMELPDLTLPARNATNKKRRAAETIATINDAFSTPIGRACVQELRSSRYAQACGYDLPT